MRYGVTPGKSLFPARNIFYNLSRRRYGYCAPDKTIFPEFSSMRPKEVVRAFVEAFNRADTDALAALYVEDAVNHQVAESPVVGREAIRRMFAESFATATMVCIVENLFEDGEWAIMEWRDPLGLWGCGFFHVIDDRIVFQRGYWDKLSFLRVQGLPLPENP